MITINYSPDQRRSIALDGDKEIGECTYQVENGIWIVNHTFVDKAYGGQGIARRLVNKIIEQARNNHIKVKATCSYAMQLFQRSEDYSDVVIK